MRSLLFMMKRMKIVVWVDERGYNDVGDVVSQALRLCHRTKVSYLCKEGFT